ncbi:hypothetical protein Goshw_001017 [Gossypium schwendimanii]|uniref:Reverse transcriptase/retrotransposon-derived protein RNase H-like domain-containing protein n=1 Tax=Gossypium schwendimanii TaxID=34291 RepID=A0A7J9L009_GOSSC|nr:hypothetical protein [Gossypium schwendimanii]
MSKKDSPPWNARQTQAVKKLKEELQNLPPLQIPSEDKRILQTNRSDKYWGAVLFEERNRKRQLCGYESGIFTNAEIHHSTFKEILAVKKDIKIEPPTPYQEQLKKALKEYQSNIPDPK